MKLSEMVASVGWAEARASLLWSYPDVEKSIEGYRRVFDSLRKLKPAASTMRLVVHQTFREELDDAPFAQVSGRNGTRNRDQADFKHLGQSADPDYADAETNFSLAFEPWEQWLGMEIDPQTLRDYTAPQIVAHCLWEMTFHGFEPSEIQAERDELKRCVAELDAMTEEERKRRLVPQEQVEQELLGDKERE